MNDKIKQVIDSFQPSILVYSSLTVPKINEQLDENEFKRILIQKLLKTEQIEFQLPQDCKPEGIINSFSDQSKFFSKLKRLKITLPNTQFQPHVLKCIAQFICQLSKLNYLSINFLDDLNKQYQFNLPEFLQLLKPISTKLTSLEISLSSRNIMNDEIQSVFSLLSTLQNLSNLQVKLGSSLYNCSKASLALSQAISNSLNLTSLSLTIEGDKILSNNQGKIDILNSIRNLKGLEYLFLDLFSRETQYLDISIIRKYNDTIKNLENLKRLKFIIEEVQIKSDENAFELGKCISNLNNLKELEFINVGSLNEGYLYNFLQEAFSGLGNLARLSFNMRSTEKCNNYKGVDHLLQKLCSLNLLKVLEIQLNLEETYQQNNYFSSFQLANLNNLTELSLVTSDFMGLLEQNWICRITDGLKELKNLKKFILELCCYDIYLKHIPNLIIELKNCQNLFVIGFKAQSSIIREDVCLWSRKLFEKTWINIWRELLSTMAQLPKLHTLLLRKKENDPDLKGALIRKLKHLIQINFE